MHIMYARKGSWDYATAATSVRKGDKVVKTGTIYLGKVIDKEKGIYENKERGLFTFDPITETFGKADLSVVPKKRPRGKRLAAADFGDAYVLDRFMDEIGILGCIDDADIPNRDTMKAMVMFYILSDRPNCCARTWYDGSYASVLYPDANLDDRRISEFLKAIGDESVKRSFFSAYIPRIAGGNVTSYLIDSTGVPNQVHMPVTAISNHNGDINLEVRLILVCRKNDRMPLYFRYIPGNVIDSSTLSRTLDELECMGIQVEYTIIDAGYCTMENMKDLVDSHIGFLTRMKPNYEMYKDMVSDHIGDLLTSSRFLYKDRFVQVFSEERKLKGSTRKVWMHLILDCDMKNSQDKSTYKRHQDGKIGDEQMEAEYRTNGMFILVSSFWIEREEVLTTYFERGGIEQLIDVGKTECRLSEAAVHSIDAMCGKWLVEFTAMAVCQSLQNAFKARKAYLMSRKRKNKDSIPGRNMSPSHALFTLRNQKCDIFDNTVLPRERTAKVNEAYFLFDYETPRRIDRDQKMP